ncbi:MAG TPA: PfkB family carbohydrate kinase [Kofleriaceae bacterium]|jgi:fructokinase|nr:PfkB family carbohydrate kinase [Kofleriaceae bacterium]
MSTDAVVIWGELLWDRFPAALGGAQLGGAPANVAWHLGQAGGWAQLVTRVGDDADGRRALAELEELVDTSLAQVDPERATGEVTVELEAGEPRYTLHAGRAWERIACSDAVIAAIRDAGVFIYGTLAQRTAEGLAEWRRAIAAAGAGVLKVYDANLRPNDRAAHVVAEALGHADVIKLNDREVGQLRGLLGCDDPIAELRARRPCIVVVTHGAAGSTIYPAEGAPIENHPRDATRGGVNGPDLPGQRGRESPLRNHPRDATRGGVNGPDLPGQRGRESPLRIDIPGVPARPGGDNVGCGDAYLALLVFGMTSGWDLAASGQIASRWAAAVAEVRGATPRFDDEWIAALLETA